MACQAQRREAHGLPLSVGSTLHPCTREATEDYKVFYRYLRLLPCDRRRRHLALAEYTICAFARVYVHFFSCLSYGLMRYRVDHVHPHHCIGAHPSCPPLMFLRSLATTQGYHMGFFFTRHFSTMHIGDRFTRERGFQTFFNKSFSDKLGLLCRYLIGVCNFIIEPATCHI